MLALWTALWLCASACTFDESKLRRPQKDAAAEQPDATLDLSFSDLQVGKTDGGPDLVPETADLVEAKPDVGAHDIAPDAAGSEEEASAPRDVPAATADLVGADDTMDSRGVSSDAGQNDDSGGALADSGQDADAGEDATVDGGGDTNPGPDEGSEAVTVPTDATDSADLGQRLDTGTADASLGNLALTGTAYRWCANSTSTANTNRVAEPKLNDDSTAADVNLAGSGWDTINNAWEAAGVILARAATVTSVVFVNGNVTKQTLGGTTYSGDGNFDANFHLQVSTDGTTWTDTVGWSVSPAYPYDESAANGSYVFSGKATGVLGVRVTGQVRLGGSLDVSWNATSREVQVRGQY
jgi:hypothetical protein